MIQNVAGTCLLPRPAAVKLSLSLLERITCSLKACRVARMMHASAISFRPPRFYTCFTEVLMLKYILIDL